MPASGIDKVVLQSNKEMWRSPKEFILILKKKNL